MAEVTEGANNNVRTQPSTSAERVGQVAAGTVVEVLEGPTCQDRLTWYRVENDQIAGWTVESVEDMYALMPYVETEEISFGGVSIDFPIELNNGFGPRNGIVRTDYGTPTSFLLSADSLEVTVFKISTLLEDKAAGFAALREVLAGETGSDITNEQVTAFYDAWWSYNPQDIYAHADIIALGETGKALRYIGFDGRLIYRVIGVIEPNYYIEALVNYELSDEVAVFLAAQESANSYLDTQPLSEIDSRFPLLDLSLSTLAIDEPVLEASFAGYFENIDLDTCYAVTPKNMPILRSEPNIDALEIGSPNPRTYNTSTTYVDSAGLRWFLLTPDALPHPIQADLWINESQVTVSSCS